MSTREQREEALGGCEFVYAAVRGAGKWYVEAFCQHPEHWEANLQVDRPVHHTAASAQKRADELNKV